MYRPILDSFRHELALSEIMTIRCVFVSVCYCICVSILFVYASPVSGEWQWAQLAISKGPLPRELAAVRYDVIKNTLILYGGKGFNANGISTVFDDTWIFHVNSLSWQQIDTPIRPPARFAMVNGINSISRNFYVSTGQSTNIDGTSVFYNDIWMFSLVSMSWQQLITTNIGPSIRSGASGGIYNSDINHFDETETTYFIVSFGINTNTNALYSDTWQLNLNTLVWTDMTPWVCIFKGFCRPGPRAQVSGIMIAAQKLFVFGGCSNGEGQCALSDAWIFNSEIEVSSRWQQIGNNFVPFLQSHPKSRQNHSTTRFNSNQVLIYGGNQVSKSDIISEIAVMSLDDQLGDNAYQWSLINISKSLNTPWPRTGANIVAIITKTDSNPQFILLNGFSNDPSTENGLSAAMFLLTSSPNDMIGLSAVPIVWPQVYFFFALALPLLFLIILMTLKLYSDKTSAEISPVQYHRTSDIGIYDSVELSVDSCTDTDDLRVESLTNWRGWSLLIDNMIHRRLGSPSLTPLTDSWVRRYIMSYIFTLTWGECIIVILFIAYSVVFMTMYAVTSESERFARAFAALALVCLTFLLLPVSRNSIWTPLIGISFERAIKWHKLLATLFLLSIFIHFIAMLIAYPRHILDINSFEVNSILGFVSLIIFFVIGATSLVERIRRQCFEIFYYIHHLSLVAMVTLLFHTPRAGVVVIPGFSLYLIDIVIRTYRLHFTQKTIISCTTITQDIAEISFNLKTDTKFIYKAGQYVFILVPQISKVQSHPYSLSSNPDMERTTMHIKSLGHGSFSHRLVELIQNGELRDIRVDGPYGNLSINPNAYFTICLFSAGIGITPIISLFSNIYSLIQQGQLPCVSKVLLVWSVKEKDLGLVERFTNRLSIPCISDIIHVIVYITKSSYSDHEIGITRDSVPIKLYPNLSTRKSREPSNGLETMEMESSQMGDSEDPQDATDFESLASTVIRHHNDESSLTKHRSRRVMHQHKNIELKAIGDNILFEFRLGRPHIGDILETIKRTSDHRGKVGVYICGPPGFNRDIEKETHRLSDDTVRFHLHQEIFIL